MLDVRANWLKYKNDPEMALKMFRAAMELVTAIKAKYVERFTSAADRRRRVSNMTIQAGVAARQAREQQV